jgi:hypothetical protein
MTKAERTGDEIARDQIVEAVRGEISKEAADSVARLLDDAQSLTLQDRANLRDVVADWWSVSEMAGEYIHQSVDGCADVIYTGNAWEVCAGDCETEEALAELGDDIMVETLRERGMAGLVSLGAYAVILHHALAILSEIGDHIENESECPTCEGMGFVEGVGKRWEADGETVKMRECVDCA